jgi:hypothetical protein
MDWSKRNNMPSKVDTRQLNKELSKSYQDAIQKQARDFAQEILNENKDQYLNEIENHPVSQEINSGPDGENISYTLDGKENLFAFIGFNSQDKPIEDLKNLIKQNTFLDKKSVFNTKTFQLKFDVFTPSIEEIKSATPLPFENGKSWVKGIEDGISGFGYYVYGLLFSNSRSKRGIQSKNKVRNGTFKTVKYMSELYSNFIRSLK